MIDPPYDEMAPCYSITLLDDLDCQYCFDFACPRNDPQPRKS